METKIELKRIAIPLWLWEDLVESYELNRESFNELGIRKFDEFLVEALSFYNDYVLHVLYGIEERRAIRLKLQNKSSKSYE